MDGNNMKNIFYYIKVTGLLLIMLFLLTGCFFFPQGSIYVTSEPSGAKIYLNGDYVDRVTPSLIPNIYPGTYLLKVTLEEESIADEESINVLQSQVTSVHFSLVSKISYRALCIGVDDYESPGIIDLRAPSYDVARLIEVFEKSRFGDEQHTFNRIDTLLGSQATRDNILQSIASSFAKADSNDVSYFYFSGHGWSDGDTSTILPHDAIAENASMDISADDLALALGRILGTKIVVLDSCHSGGFIGKDVSISVRGIRENDINQFNNNLIKSFELYDLQLRKDNLAKKSFKVITSASGDQECFETINHPIDGNPFGYFSASLSEGCGYNDFVALLPADYDMNNQITLNEIYLYIKDSLKFTNQDVQVYPINSSFSFLEY
jgi:hypothetical protein